MVKRLVNIEEIVEKWLPVKALFLNLNLLLRWINKLHYTMVIAKNISSSPFSERLTIISNP
jgi:hypothetical protein